MLKTRDMKVRSQAKTSLPESFRTRPARLEDLPNVVALANACDKALIGLETESENRYRVSWTSPHFEIERDSLVVEDGHGRLVAWAYISARPPFVNAWLRASVHPEFVGRGVGSHLTAWGEQRARAATAKAPDGVRTCVESGALVQDERAARLLKRHGLSMNRHFVYMLTNLERALPDPRWPKNVALRPVDRESQDRVICLAHVEAFRDHWGHIERSDDEEYRLWRHWCEHDEELDTSLWFIAWDGDEVAGMSLCWPTAENDPETGYVGVLCVRRAWRGCGLGEALMQHSFRVFKDRGYPKAALHADGENITGALRLYHKCGMEIERQYDHFEKTLRDGKELRVESIEDVQ